MVKTLLNIAINRVTKRVLADKNLDEHNMKIFISHDATRIITKLAEDEAVKFQNEFFTHNISIEDIVRAQNSVSATTKNPLHPNNSDAYSTGFNINPFDSCWESPCSVNLNNLSKYRLDFYPQDLDKEEVCFYLESIRILDGAKLNKFKNTKFLLLLPAPLPEKTQIAQPTEKRLTTDVNQLKVKKQNQLMQLELFLLEVQKQAEIKEPKVEAIHIKNKLEEFNKQRYKTEKKIAQIKSDLQDLDDPTKVKEILERANAPKSTIKEYYRISATKAQPVQIEPAKEPAKVAKSTAPESAEIGKPIIIEPAKTIEPSKIELKGTYEEQLKEMFFKSFQEELEKGFLKFCKQHAEEIFTELWANHVQTLSWDIYKEFSSPNKSHLLMYLK